MEENIKSMALQYGADVCGIGSVDRFVDAPAGFSPLDIYEKCKSVIAVGIALPKGLYEIEPRLIYGHFNAEICTEVDRVTLKLAKEIERKYECFAIPVPADAPNEYWEADTMTAKGLMSMKHAAVMCGIGSLGKSSLLINEEYGNRLTLGAVLTNLELESDEMQPDLCLPKCRLCIENCPAQAILHGSVEQKKCRLNTYGKTARGFDTVDCNNCRTICPMKYGKSR